MNYRGYSFGSVRLSVGKWLLLTYFVLFIMCCYINHCFSYHRIQTHTVGHSAYVEAILYNLCGKWLKSNQTFLHHIINNNNFTVIVLNMPVQAAVHEMATKYDTNVCHKKGNVKGCQMDCDLLTHTWRRPVIFPSSGHVWAAHCTHRTEEGVITEATRGLSSEHIQPQRDHPQLWGVTFYVTFVTMLFTQLWGVNKVYGISNKSLWRMSILVTGPRICSCIISRWECTIFPERTTKLNPGDVTRLERLELFLKSEEWDFQPRASSLCLLWLFVLSLSPLWNNWSFL